VSIFWRGDGSLRQGFSKNPEVTLALEAERLYHQVEVRICMEKNGARLKGAARDQNIRGGYGEASAPELKSVFASRLPKIVVRFNTVQGIKAAFQPSVFLLGLGACKNFEFDNARFDNRVLFEQ
jgi:hypothetical protein